MSYPKGGHFTHVSCDRIVARGPSRVVGPATEVITGARTLTMEDAGKTFEVRTDGSDYDITLPPLPNVAGFSCRFVVGDISGPFVTIVAGTRDVYLRALSVPGGTVGITNAISPGVIIQTGTAEIGDYLDFSVLANDDYLATGLTLEQAFIGVP